MEPERWRRMWSVFHEVLERAPEEREGVLCGAVGDDPDLLAEVRQLLADHDDAPSVLDPLEDGVGVGDDPLIGKTVDGYRIERIIGRGGMGTVYEATQDLPLRRRVALKLIHAGMDTAEVVERFDAERQALAIMDHPNIATVHDAGATPEGRPYFVMELVDGLPILDAADAARMTVTERLELFLTICRAVQHAHQKGVIHRDLKPSNILVAEHDGEPVAKIIDFGIAKAIHRPLTGHTLTTAQGRLIGTPEYMSPEQEAAESDIDTRTDVYSLGVVLHELLTGSRPVPRGGRKPPRTPASEGIGPDLDTPSHRLSTLGETAGAVATNRRTDPTGLRKRLAGDLDWIVLKALEFDRERRYATAAELATDIARHLKDEPVVAGPPALAYRALKFVRRHRIGVAVGLALAVTLILGIVGTSWMAIVARDQRKAALAARDEAREDAETARAVIAVLDEILSAPDPMGDFPTAGETRDVKVVEVLDRADELLPGLADRPAVEAALRRTLGKTYLELGRPEAAEIHFRRAVELNTLSYGPEHPDTLASSHDLAWALKELGRLDEAEAVLRPVLEARRRVLGPDHQETLASTLNLANVVFLRGRMEEAELILDTLIPELKRTLGERHSDTINALNTQTLVLSRLGKHHEAEAVAREALILSRSVHGEDHPFTLRALGNLATVLEEGDSLEEAEESFRDLVSLNRRVLGEDHPSTLLSMQNLASVLSRLGRSQEAAPVLAEVLESYRRSLGPSHPNTLVTAHNLARTLTETGDAEQAVAIYHEILPVARQRFGPGHYLVATFEGGLGASLLELRRFTEAETHLMASYNRLNEIFGPENRRSRAARERLVELFEAWNQPEAADRYR